MTAALTDFVRRLTDDVSADRVSETDMTCVVDAMTDLVADDSWLPDEYAVADPNIYRQYLLYCDPLERFSVVSFVWAPGQKTPIHDHTVWGVVGQLRGNESSQSYEINEGSAPTPIGEIDEFKPGDVMTVSPAEIDVHIVSNSSDDVAISIHCYGANIGKVNRHTFDPETGQPNTFISGYINNTLPNIWS